MRTILLIVAVVVFTTSTALAHRWEWVSYDSPTSLNSVYMDADSLLNVQEMFAMSEPCFQALFKVSNNICVINFRVHEGNKYLCSFLLPPEAVEIWNTSIKAQEDARYTELRGRGASPAQARRIINREHEVLAGDLWHKCFVIAKTYGTDTKNGAFNPIGACFLYKMATLNPDAAIKLARTFGFSANYEPIFPDTVALRLCNITALKLVLPAIANH